MSKPLRRVSLAGAFVAAAVLLGGAATPANAQVFVSVGGRGFGVAVGGGYGGWGYPGYGWGASPGYGYGGWGYPGYGWGGSPGYVTTTYRVTSFPSYYSYPVYPVVRPYPAWGGYPGYGAWGLGRPYHGYRPRYRYW